MRISDWSSDVCSSDLQNLRERLRYPDAPVRDRAAGHLAAVEGDSVPCQPLHERHRRKVIKVGIMVDVLFKDAEDPGRCLETLAAGGNGRDDDFFSPAIDVAHLCLDRKSVV